MVQLKVLSGKKAGLSLATRDFPVRIGRAADCDLRLEDAGVWEQHFCLHFKPAEGFLLKSEPNALVQVNGLPVSETLLRNGDTLDIGAARIQFWLGSVRQSSPGLREALSWALILAAVICQIWMLYWLLA